MFRDKNYNAGELQTTCRQLEKQRPRLKKGGDAALIDTIGEGQGFTAVYRN